VTLYAGIWVAGRALFLVDDLQLKPLALVNVLRRPGCPLTVTSADGKTVYAEGKDFHEVAMPNSDRIPGPASMVPPSGASLKLTSGSRIREGDEIRVSWYHPSRRTATR